MKSKKKPRMSKAVAKAIRKYNDELLERVRRVPCSRCGAKKNKKCRGRWQRTKGCHAARHNEAKRAGHLGGRWFDCKRWGVYF